MSDWLVSMLTRILYTFRIIEKPSGEKMCTFWTKLRFILNKLFCFKLIMCDLSHRYLESNEHQNAKPWTRPFTPNLWSSEARRWEQIRCSRPVSNTLHVLRSVGMLLDFLLLLSPSCFAASKIGLHEDPCPSCPCGTNIMAKSTSVDRAFWDYREKNEQTPNSLYWKVASIEEGPELFRGPGPLAPQLLTHLLPGGWLL